MGATAVPSKAARGALARAIVWLVIGLGLLTASATALYFSSRNDELTAYNAAPLCATFADAAAGQNCRYTTTVTVTDIGGDNEVLYIALAEPNQSGSPFVARLPVRDTPLRDGDQVPAEFWGLKVTKLGGELTVDHPANDRRPRTLLVIGLLLLPLALGATAWGALSMRRWHQGPHDEATASPSMGPLAGSDVLWR